MTTKTPVFKRGAPRDNGRRAVYLVFTRSFGIIQKIDSDIGAARQWAKRALGVEAVSTVPLHNTTTGAQLTELEAEWRAVQERRAE